MDVAKKLRHICIGENRVRDAANIQIHADKPSAADDSQYTHPLQFVRLVAERGYVGEYSEQEEVGEEAEEDMDDPSASSRMYTSAGTCGMSSRASSTGRSCQNTSKQRGDIKQRHVRSGCRTHTKLSATDALGRRQPTRTLCIRKRYTSWALHQWNNPFRNFSNSKTGQNKRTQHRNIII